jgi:formylglycine-generating enzyme required for sulfatase activity
MIFPLSDLLSLEIQMPRRWVLGETRRVGLRLHNASGLEVTQLDWRPCWEESAGAEDHWRKLGTLRRETSLPLDFILPVPPRTGETFFQLHLRGRVGSLLDLELWSTKLVVQVSARPGSGGMNVVIQGDIQGGFGAIGSEGGSGAGHVLNFHGSNPLRDFEDWLRDDPSAAEWKPLPLHLVRETCLTWANAQSVEMAGIPAGNFHMGASVDDPGAEPEEKPQREVHLTRGFWMSRHLVTNALFTRVMDSPSPVTLTGHLADKMPVANLTWGQAMAFCERLTELEKAAGTLPRGYAYRLPTEAQWEYACRAGSNQPRYGKLADIGSLQANGGHMVEVGRFLPNAWGLHDMLGLVFEWCMDAHAPYQRADTTDPLSREVPPGQPLKRVIRGGCYQGPDVCARASARFGRESHVSSHRIGFRVVLARETGGPV